MRIVPIITALLVAGLLYGIVIERERLLQFARDLSPTAAAPSPEMATDVTEEEPPAEEAAAEPQAPAEGAVGVIAMRSAAQEIDSAVVLRGETQPDRQVDVLAEVSGKVISTPLRKGAFVDEGQTLCELDPGTTLASLAEAEARLSEAQAQIPEVEARVPEAEARLEEAKARLEEARINANAAAKLSEGGFASDTRVANTEAAVRSAEAGVSSAEAGLKAARSGMQGVEAAIESAEAAMARAQTQIDHLTITAPFAGVLETDTAELGTLMQSQGGNALCATILQLDPLKLVAFVPETQVGRIEVGATAGARLTEGGDISGKVTFLSRSADMMTRTFRVEITVPNPDLRLRSGQTAEIAIQADGAMAHLIPSSALTLDDQGTLGVRTVDDDSLARFMPVTLMRDTRDGVWVTGLPDSVNVITVGQEYVTDGVAVAPSYEDVIQ
ncbi:efflux RND transporter periplasmic adaptor subunit [Thalassococcus sp. BH17M4-6]|uniref:efflux RND transporter periplasmic adaptor subunit n=1 Tax=Thalassococcus sp. BH17M4-6 TaxID=3413148 RepID=UPI003BDFAA8B